MKKQNDVKKVLVLVVSPSRRVAEVVRERFGEVTAELISKEELLGRSLPELLRLLRQRRDLFVVFCADLETQRRMFFLKSLCLLAKAKHKLIVDENGISINVSAVQLVFQEVATLLFDVSVSAASVFRAYVKLFLSPPLHHPVQLEPLEAGDAVAYLRTDFQSGLAAGGSVAHTIGVARAFKQLGYEPFFIFSGKLDVPQENRIPVYVVRPARFPNAFWQPALLALNSRFTNEAEFIMNRHRPRLIYQRSALGSFAGLALSRKFRIPLVLEFNSSDVWTARHWGRKLRFESLFEKIERRNLQWANLIVVVSEVMKEQLVSSGIDAAKVLVNFNGVDPETYCRQEPDSAKRDLKVSLGIDESKIVVGFVGTFGTWHGAQILAAAVKPVVERNRDVHFLLVGDGKHMPEVKSIIARDGVADYVTLTGLVPQKETPRYLGICDILASPHVPNPDGSPFFGSPIKLFEYMAAGKGIVASGLGQIGDVLKNSLRVPVHGALEPAHWHDKLAVLVTPGNVEELANGILFLARNSDIREALGENARKEMLAKYTWQQNVRRLLERIKQG